MQVHMTRPARLAPTATAMAYPEAAARATATACLKSG